MTATAARADLIRVPTGKPFAREIVVAPRLPPRPKHHTGNPFTSEGDMVADCAVVDETTGKRCGYHVMGSRSDVKLALDRHHQMYHPESIGVVLLNQARQ